MTKGDATTTRHVIHTLDPAAREAEALVRALTEREPGAHEVVWVGPQRERGVEKARLDPAGHAIVERAKRVGAGPVRAWGAAALRACAGLGDSRDVTGVLIAPPPNTLSAIARMALRRAFSRPTVFHDERIRAAWGERLGLRGPLGARPVERQTLPIGASKPHHPADDALVLMDVGGPPEQRDAHRLCFIAGVLTLAGTRCDFIVHPTSRGVGLAEAFVRHHGDRWRMRTDQRPAWELLGAIDIAVWLADPWVAAGYRTHRSPPTTLALEAAIAHGTHAVVEDHPLALAIAEPAGARVIEAGDALAMNRAIAAIARERAGEPAALAHA